MKSYLFVTLLCLGLAVGGCSSGQGTNTQSPAGTPGATATRTESGNAQTSDPSTAPIRSAILKWLTAYNDRDWNTIEMFFYAGCKPPSSDDLLGTIRRQRAETGRLQFKTIEDITVSGDGASAAVTYETELKPQLGERTGGSLFTLRFYDGAWRDTCP